MIIMDLKLNNFCAFKDFHINFSYPKKVVHSYIENEYLPGYPNFRFKRVNILMGSNATGKTTLGKMLMSIFVFINRQNINIFSDVINKNGLPASFSIDFIPNGKELYHVDAVFETSCSDNDAKLVNSQLNISKAAISTNDSYEMCKKKLKPIEGSVSLSEKLSVVPYFGWFFSYPMDSLLNRGKHTNSNNNVYLNVLENILRTLDPSIVSVEKSNEVANSYIIHFHDRDLFVQDGDVIRYNTLSSGTKYGIDIADIVTAIITHSNGFYYCDEKFSYINSDIEKAILSVMIDTLNQDEQLFFTTHNMDILDMMLPKHSYTFLKKENNENGITLKCLYASDYLKRNTDSLKNAVENDLFSTAPDLRFLFDIMNLQK